MLKVPSVDLRAQYQALKPEIDLAIQRVFDRGQFILGEEVAGLEREVAAFCGTTDAVAVASGTDALEFSLRACGIGPGDDVIVPAMSFFASAGAVAALGARPVFADIDPETYTIDPSLIERAITPKTKGILPVHLYGHPSEMRTVLEIARRRKLCVIEDCAQAFGASLDGRRVGTFGDCGAFSFYPTKNLGAFGDGGMVTTNRAELAEQIRRLRVHGSRDRIHHEIVSRHSRLDEIQAAVLRVKLHYVDSWNEVRRAHAQTYRRAFEQHGLADVGLPIERPGARHVYHLFVVRVEERPVFQQALAAAGVSTLVHYEVPLHLEAAFASLGYRRGACPEAERATEEVVSLPIYPELPQASLAYVVEQVAHAYARQ